MRIIFRFFISISWKTCYKMHYSSVYIQDKWAKKKIGILIIYIIKNYYTMTLYNRVQFFASEMINLNTFAYVAF